MSDTRRIRMIMRLSFFLFCILLVKSQGETMFSSTAKLPAPTITPSPTSGDDNGTLSAAVIAAIGLLLVVVVVVMIFGIMLWICKACRRRRQSYHPLPLATAQPTEKTLDESGASPRKAPALRGHSKSTAMVQFVDQIDLLKCDSSGKEFTNSDHDITLRVPEGAIPDGVTVHIEAGVALHGPFQFPPGTRPISPIVWFCMQEDVPLLKPVEVILPHFLHNWKGVELGFLKADHSTYTTDDGEERYMFQHLNDPMDFCFENGRGFGILSMKHFCSLCIQSNITHSQLPSKAQYCLTEVIPDPWPSTPIDVPLHFCVTFFLKTCFETLKKQFPPGVKILRHKFTFQTSESDISEPKLQFEVHEPQFGWILALKCKEIRAADVDYWDEGGTKERPGLQLMEDEKMYPPRLTIEACGTMATGNSVVQLKFKGSCEDLSTDILLPIYHQASALPVSPSLSSAKSTSSISSSVGGGYAANVSWNERDYHIEDQKPKLPALLKFPTERGNISIPQRIGTNHKFGVFLLDDETGAIVDGIAQEHRGNTDDINTEILKKWLQGRGRQPVTWRTLIEVLRDSQLTPLANDIERNLSRL